MKLSKTVILFTLAAGLAACGRADAPVPAAPDFTDPAASVLILEYSPSGLMVTRKNAHMNCAIKEGGIECEISVDGDEIGYCVHQGSEISADCICLVKEMSSVVQGLSVGSEYTLYYWCRDEMPLVPISFTYEEGLVLSIDTDLYIAELEDMGDGTWRANVPYWDRH